MNDDIVRTKERVKITNEVFTSPELIQEILEHFPLEDWSVNSPKVWIDPAAGNGNFLVAAKERLIEHGHSEEASLLKIFGVELMDDNVEVIKDRLDPEKKFRHIVDENIVQADALRYHYRFDGSYPYDDEMDKQPQFNEIFE